MTELSAKIGKLLRLEREKQALSLEDVCERTKIPVENLEQIENGQVDALPSEVYYNLFAKTYAEALGIDFTATVEAIKEDIGQPLEPAHAGRKKREANDRRPARHEHRPAEKEDAENARRRLLAGLLYLVGGVVILFLAFILIQKVFLDVGNEAGHVTTSAQATAPPDQAVAEPHENRQGSREPSSEGIYVNYDWNVPAYVPSPPLRLRLVTERESWAEVFADGDTVLYQTLRAGREYDVEARYRLSFLIAVPAGVRIEFNDQPIDLRELTAGRVSRIAVDQAGVQSFLTRSRSAPRPASELEGQQPASPSDSPNQQETPNAEVGGKENGEP